MPKQRFESLLANYCAPALKQYKYANMFHLPKDDDSIRSFIKQYNQQFNSKGIFFILIEQETAVRMLQGGSIRGALTRIRLITKTVIRIRQTGPETEPRTHSLHANIRKTVIA